ncbi:hypothetical protein KY290_025907 [Solanum tuberosum]|uniref:Uncharacterized protein n=2 Tax=Solanum TaxID=4107 RepID=A0ABQ7ULX8_SOLTU|nr:hypothetical protein KY290_029864 [Solanum tuberosum]KAH0755637.1 hypothetical protein KY290_025907 [Solanum tuberosum]
MSIERAERRVVSVRVCNLVKEGLTSTRLRVVILVDITRTPRPRLMTLAQSLKRIRKLWKNQSREEMLHTGVEGLHIERVK